MNAVVQDAFLGRGTRSPILAILNQMGLYRDENAPQFVPDEVMATIGPSRPVDRLEQKLKQMQTSLCETYGRPSKAPVELSQKYKELQTSLRAARQKHRRKTLEMLRENYFKQRNDEELQNQLHGIHKPLEAKRVVYESPERQRVATILGDFDEDLSNDEIVRRKIEAIKALVAYAFVCEPRQQHKRKCMDEPSSQDQQHKRRRSEATLIQETTTVETRQLGRPIWPKPVSLTASTEVPATPPPPYSPRDPGQLVSKELVHEKRRRAPSPCIFCGKKYTRSSSLWDHLEAHLETIKGGWVKCPACSIGCKNTEAFMAHAARAHAFCFRRQRVKLLRAEGGL